jgi:hypothetical protein
LLLQFLLFCHCLYSYEYGHYVTTILIYFSTILTTLCPSCNIIKKPWMIIIITIFPNQFINNRMSL